MRSTIPLVEDFVIEDMTHWPEYGRGFSILARMENGDIWISNWLLADWEEAFKHMEMMSSIHKKQYENKPDGILHHFKFNGWKKAKHKWIRLDEMNIPTFGRAK